MWDDGPPGPRVRSVVDYLKECMNDVGNPPLDAMHRNFCLVCANRQCDRAGTNQSAFDARVKNWRSLLFENVPRAAPDDEKYSNIRAKSFAPGGPVRPPPTTVFMPGVPVIARPDEPAPKPTAFVQQEVAGPAAPEPVSADLPVDPGRAVARPAEAANTAFEQGAMLEGAPAAAPSPPSPAPSGKTFILDDD